MRQTEEVPSFSDIPTLSLELSTPPRFLLAGRFIGGPAWVHSRRVIDSFEVILGIEGTLHLAEAGREYRVGPDDVLLLRPGVEHGGLSPSPGGISFYWAHFQTTPHPGPGPSPALRLPSWLPGRGVGSVRAAMLQLQADQTPVAAGPLLADYRMGTLLLELQGAWTSGPAPAPTGWFGQLLEWIRIQPAQHLTVAHLAARCGRHPDHLARVFRERLGVAPLEYLHRRRADEAKRRLVETSLPVKRIAWDLGIRDERQFSRFFRAQTGFSPTEYRHTYSRVRINVE